MKSPARPQKAGRGGSKIAISKARRYIPAEKPASFTRRPSQVTIRPPKASPNSGAKKGQGIPLQIEGLTAALPDLQRPCGPGLLHTCLQAKFKRPASGLGRRLQRPSFRGPAVGHVATAFPVFLFETDSSGSDREKASKRKTGGRAHRGDVGTDGRANGSIRASPRIACRRSDRSSDPLNLTAASSGMTDVRGRRDGQTMTTLPSTASSGSH